ncbi:hypothetical protein lerEdw1_006548 [Lerista edwardsae]|nr:hypothetical protein lerEdw1_006548 [Lerista edwardsae]
MERKLSRPWSGLRVLCVIFLHWNVAFGAFRTIDPGNLKKIVQHIAAYGIEGHQYAVAARLDGKYCKNPSPANLQAALPKSEMEKMRDAIRVEGGIYNPEPVGNVVAARPNPHTKVIQHAEWRLLEGGINSPAAKLLRYKPPDSCLIFLSKLAPCKERCFNPSDTRNLVQWINPLFKQLNEDSRAFVFQIFYRRDFRKDAAILADGWRAIKDAPPIPM